MEPIAKINSVSKRFGRKQAVKNVSFEINPGEIFGFVGPNGAGKTTVIKMMTGLLKMDSGSIAINGFDVKKEFEKAMEGVGGIIENPEVYDYLTGMENLLQHARPYRNIEKEYIEKTVELVKLSKRINDKVKKYSLGMKQRLGIAQALLHQPNLLILDEPTNGLDPMGIKELRDLLKYLAHEKGIGIMVSSHLLSEMQIMCDRVGFISEGEMIAFKTIDEILNESKETSVYQYEVDDPVRAQEICAEQLGLSPKETQRGFEVEADKEQSAEINRVLVENGIKVYLFTQETKSLEDEYMDVTKNYSEQKKDYYGQEGYYGQIS